LKEKRNDKGTEEKILIAARQVFIEKGLAGARMQDIADRLRSIKPCCITILKIRKCFLK